MPNKSKGTSRKYPKMQDKQNIPRDAGKQTETTQTSSQCLSLQVTNFADGST